MNTELMLDTETMADAQLVELSLLGDRDAFGGIVARYQSIICALAFSACGNLARSEDLAQEIFIRAWRNLAHLQEPGHLKAWLCGIARNVINHSFREEARNPLAGSEPLEESVAQWTDFNTPPDQAITQEEAALMWRVLEGLPRAYRDPMVLFYRQEESARQVAEALGISEESVRQRLSRGRAMLNDRLARLVESGLRRVAPSSGFSAAVIAALPMMGLPSGTAGALAAAAQGSGAKAAGLLGSMLAALTTILPVLAGLVSLWGRVQAARSSRERRFVVLTTFGLLVWAAVVMLVSVLTFSHGQINVATRFSDALGVSLLWLALCGPLDAYAIWIGRRQRQIRLEQSGGNQPPEQESTGMDPGISDQARKGFKASVCGTFAAMIFGGTGWFIMLAFHASDTFALGAIALITVGSWLAACRATLRRPKTFAQVLIAVLWGLVLFDLAVANCCWDAWTNGAAVTAFPARLAPPGINLLILVLFGSIRVGWYLKKRLVPARELKGFVTRALLTYGLTLLLGFAGFLLARAGEGPLPVATQTMINEFQPDGSIRFDSSFERPNSSSSPLHTFRFVNSDFVQVDKMSDRSGRPLKFATGHEGNTYDYTVTLNDPVPPGAMVFIRSEGTMTGRVQQLQPGQFEFREQHWPGTGLPTRRIEVHRLPAGAKIVRTDPTGLSTHQLPDGRIELRLERLIPPGGKITVQIRYALASSER